MNLKKSFKTLTGLVLSAAFVGIVVSCGDKKSAAADTQQPMVIVFASGQAKVFRAGTGMDARVGLIVNQDDSVKTENGTVDLQTKGGSAVRIREFTEVTIAKLTHKDTKLNMSSGSLLATVKKESSDENFRIVTPTAIAGVRGTTFSVEVTDGREAKVKVLDGKVAMAPRVEALEKYSDEEIEKSPTLKKLSEISVENEVVLEEKMEGKISPEMEKTVASASKKIEDAKKNNQSVEKAVKIEEVTLSIDKAKKEDKGIKIEKVEITAQEKSEKETLVVVDPKAFQKIIESKDDKSAAEATKTIVAQRSEKQEEVLKHIEKEASKTTLNSEAEIKKHYDKLELIIMKNGTEMKGAVIAQTGTQLVIHTSEGVKRVEKEEVSAQEFLY
jgi:hypothetical protein